jgi:hypothetical protein
MRLVYVQYGDYAEALRRLDEGGAETYQAQRHTVEWVRRTAERHPTCVICLNSSSRTEETVAGGRVLCIGRSLYEKDSPWDIAALVEAQKPDAVICRTPLCSVLDWAGRHGVACLPLLADSSSKPGFRQMLRRRRLGRSLRSGRLPCVANHSLSASRWLKTLGVAPERIVPWEFPAALSAGPVKSGQSGGAFRLLYVGAVIEEKGVGDLVEAVAVLSRTLPCSLTVAGEGRDRAGFESRAKELGIDASFLGSVPYPTVSRLMRESDAVVVPSRHAYPEGLPNTVYEGLASGTPVLVSDHPVIVERVADGETALVFRASDPASMAAAMSRLASDRALYARLSSHGEHAYRALYVGVEWSELLSRFVADPVNKSGWVAPLSLSAVEAKLEQRRRMVRLVPPTAQPVEATVTAR